MVDSRILLGATQEYWCVRGISFVMGLGALVVLYHFSWRLFSSRSTAILSVLFLLFLPSHLFYSRSGLPEAATTFFVISGFYFYCFPRSLGPRTFLAGLFFTCAFFTNYRLLILPILTFAGEFLLSKAEERSLDLKKWGWTVAIFGVFILLACLNNRGEYFIVTSGWMWHQVGLAVNHFAWGNIFTYPYGLFRLESWAFGLLFSGGIYFVWKKDWLKAFPFILVCFWMTMFSFSSDKALRYMSAVLPFMALSAAVAAVAVLESGTRKFFRQIVIVLVIIAIGTMAFKSFQLVINQSHHKRLHQYLTNLDPKAKIVSTQPMILGLDYDDIHQIISCPGIKEPSFLELPENGFNYLVLGPQAYVSWTASGISFDGELGGFLRFFDKKVRPLNVFPHMNKTMLERFVFEHNQNLMSSITFLEKATDHAGERRVYDIQQGLELLEKATHLAEEMQSVKKIRTSAANR